jgi:hypothetical protein
MEARGVIKSEVMRHYGLRILRFTPLFALKDFEIHSTFR